MKTVTASGAATRGAGVGAGRAKPRRSALAGHWDLDPDVVFLNHGSFGACPREVLAEQSRIRGELEREPIRFFVERSTGLIDAAREALGPFVGAAAEDVVFVANATTGVATVLEHLGPGLRPGDEILAGTHEYPGCMTNLRRVAGRSGATVVSAAVPFPLKSADEVVEAFLAKVTPRTRVALVSHITAPSALVLPVERIVPELERRGVITIVDGAHAVGQVPLALDKLGASFYTANCHKWLCTPKGSALLHVRRDRQEGLRPLVLSNNAEKPKPGRKHLLTEFDYCGTSDYTAWMTIPAALRVVGGMVPGGLPEVMKRNHELVVGARRTICERIGVEPPAPESMLGSLATIFLPEVDTAKLARLMARPTRYHDALQDALLDRHGIQVPVWSAAPDPRRLIRVAAQLYNSMEEYEYLAGALPEELERERAV